MANCSRCGQPLEEGVKFCGACGAPIGAQPAYAPPSPEGARKKRFLLLVLVVALFAAAVVGVYLVTGGLHFGGGSLSISVSSYTLENYSTSLYAEEYTVSLTNSGGGSVTVYPEDFNLVTSSGQTIPAFVCVPSIYTNCTGYIEQTTLQAGRFVNGIVGFRAPKNDPVKEINYAGGGTTVSTSNLPAPLYVSIVETGYVTVNGDPNRCLSVNALLGNQSGYFDTGQVIDFRFEAANSCNAPFQIQSFSIAEKGFTIKGTSVQLPVTVPANTYGNYTVFDMYVVAPNYSYANPLADYVPGLDITTTVTQS